MTTYELVEQQAKAPDADTVNAFMRQKDAVLALITASEVFEAKRLLDVLHPLWNALGFGYKGRELYRTIRDKARHMIQDNLDFLAGERKNSRVRSSTESENSRLETLAREC